MKAFGSFIKIEGIEFRTEAYIQWGEEKDTIGGILLYNPGNAYLSDAERQQKFLHSEKEIVFGELLVSHNDPIQTIGQIMEECFSNLSGRLHIYNLLNKKGSNRKDAFTWYQENKHTPAFQGYLFSPIPKDLPWIWGAWTKDNHLTKPLLYALKERGGLPNIPLIGVFEGNIDPIWGARTKAAYPPYIASEEDYAKYLFWLRRSFRNHGISK
ncbi:hypothetical protein [Bacillus sp. FJAT-29814]|uniref:hypothetical protein n=1 Tax=Bacillus sp. FJAT-29814 TaxID=1729688 RepID=UPI00082B5913|nr:hypothetical protein [Bacillus sp. FJAT-29814]